MNTRFEAVRPLEPGKPVEIHERDERGFLVGAWIGYWNFKWGIVMLYPNVKNRFVNWPGGRIPDGKRQISDRLVTVRGNDAVQDKPSVPQRSEISEVDGDGRRARKTPLPGQQIMNFK